MYARFLSASLFSFALLLFTVAPPASCVERERIDRLVAPYLENEITIGLSVGVIDDGQRENFGYGRLSAKIDRQPDGATVYEIGSISKVFTGILLAAAVELRAAFGRNQVGGRGSCRARSIGHRHSIQLGGSRALPKLCSKNKLSRVCHTERPSWISTSRN